MNELKVGVIINYISIVVRLSTSFLLTPFIIKSLGVDEYGIFILSSMVLSWLALSDMGLGSAVYKYVTAYRAKKEDERQQYFLGQAIMLFCALGCVALIAGGICYFYLDSFFPKLTESQQGELRILYLLTLSNFILSFPLRPLGCVPGAYLKFIVPGIVGLLTSLLNAGLTVCLLMWGYKAIGLTVMGVGVGIAGLLWNVYYTIHVLKVKIVFCKPDFPLYKELFRFSFWVLLGSIMDLFYWRAGAFVLANVSGATAVSLFTLATSFAMYFMTASTAISGVLSPKIMQMVAVDADKAALTRTMIRAGRLQLALLLLFIMGFIVLGRDFLTLWVGKSIGENVGIVWSGALIVLIPLLIPLSQNIGLSLLMAMNIHKGRSIILFYTSLICVVLGYLLSLWFGVLGMFVGTGISLTLGQGMMMNIYYHRKAGLNIPLFLKQTYLPALLPMIIMAVTGFGILWVLPVTDWGSLGIVAAIYVSFCSVLLFFTYLNREEKKVFISPVKKLIWR